MNHQETRRRLHDKAVANALEEVAERLERGEGSGAPSFFGGREAGRPEQDGAEGLPQISAVSPGLAEAAIIELIAKIESQGNSANAAAYELDDGEHDEQVAYQDGLAYAYNWCAELLFGLLPKPDSEQRRKAVGLKPMDDSIEADAAANNGTASGRRNAVLSGGDRERQPDAQES